MSESPSSAPDWRRIAQALILVAATVVCYLPSLNGGYLWDDRLLLVDNPLVKTPAGLWQIWFSAASFDYYPLTYSSYWLEWLIWGADPLGYRVDSLLLHVGSALLFWRLLALWRLPGAWAGGLLFALHPLNAASVAWIAERKNVLAMFWYIAALVCWVRGEESGAARRWYFATMGAFGLALISKASVVMFPFVLLLIVWFRTGRIGLGDIARSAPFFGLSFAAGLASIWFQHRTMVAVDLATVLPLPARAALIGKCLWFYLGKTWFPHPLAMIYPRWKMTSLGVADFLPLVALVLLVGALGWAAFARGWRGPAAALAYFVTTLLTVAGVFHMTFYSISYVSDHLAPLALLSMYPLCATAFAMPGRAATSRQIVLAALVLGSGVLCWERAADFGSGERLWRKTLAVNPASPAAQNNYALALDENGKLREAEAVYRPLVQAHPDMVDALTNFAANLQEQHRWTEAAEVYRRTLAVSDTPANLNNYGVVLLNLGDAKIAAAQFRQAVAQQPDLFSAHLNLYRAATFLGDREEAERERLICEKLAPGSLNPADKSAKSLNNGE